MSTTIIDALRGIDTPTVCNAMIVMDPALRGRNYTLDTVVAANPGLPPFTGYALTAKIVSSQPCTDSPEVMAQRRYAYYKYLADAGRPTVVVMEDCGSRPGVGSIWGEINASLHKAMGVAGVVTNGAIRDLDTLPAGYQLLGGNVTPGSGFAHLVDFDTPVTVFGLAVRPGDLVHADRHGCVVIRPDLVEKLPAAIARVQQRESTLLKVLNGPDFDYDKLIAAWHQFEIK
ncbi:RraA family protein [Achromobacter aloeverae]|uniref:Putative 4-hydroxy-4-methyl-2-oxoglutarate aldolase n=1 Tax=Achromobacter aloeverae TaxID=1750518 RepID=A0A4Q1HGR0_9BURK|nr:RraA family protein [Achromobacter aloeverae]RXN85317.1 acyl transferase [Achromobacter aloeverae]